MAVLTVGFVPSAYEPHYVVGEQLGERQPHSARVCIRDEHGRMHWAVPVGKLYTSEPEEEEEL
jgi:hypothetical protein